jgi:hypothetical protein
MSACARCTPIEGLDTAAIVVRLDPQELPKLPLRTMASDFPDSGSRVSEFSALQLQGTDGDLPSYVEPMKWGGYTRVPYPRYKYQPLLDLCTPTGQFTGQSPSRVTLRFHCLSAARSKTRRERQGLEGCLGVTVTKANIQNLTTLNSGSTFIGNTRRTVRLPSASSSVKHSLKHVYGLLLSIGRVSY